MPSWFKKVFSTGDGRAPEPAPAPVSAAQAAPAPVAPHPAPRPAAPQAFNFGDGRPKIRKVINAPIIVAEEERSSYRDRKSTRLNSSHIQKSRMPSSA